MASTSTSHSHRSRLYLRLTDQDACAARTYPLYALTPDSAGFDLASEGVVHEKRRYSLLLLSDADLPISQASACVNGEEFFNVNVLRLSSGAKHNDADMHGYQLLLPQDKTHLFKMSYGFASIEIDLRLDSGESLFLATKDIPCICDNEDQEQAVAGILSELTEGSGEKAIQWMMATSVSSEGRMPLVEGAPVVDASKSLRAYLSLCEKILAGYERHMSYFRSHAHSRTVKTTRIVPPSGVRRLGRNELTWLAQTPEALYETSVDTAIRIEKKHYIAKEVQTERMKKSCDNQENRALLSFIGAVAQSLRDVEQKACDQLENLRAMGSRLEKVDAEGGLLPALVVINACLEREEPLVARLSELRSRASRVQKIIQSALPEVLKVRYKIPKRSKVFQEVLPYASIYTLMEAWEKFGHFELLRESFALHTWKMDKLYEYYVLFKLLDWLAQSGFQPDETLSSPIRQIHYSLRSRYFENESQVANSFCLSRGGERVRLLYEPVLYGDSREEAGVALHRTTRSKPFDSSSWDSYWTPDFVMTHEVGKKRRSFIFDAKFRTVDRVRGDGSDNDAQSCFESCYLKYKGSILGQDGRAIDSMWLLCGRSSAPHFLVYQTSSWAQACGLNTPDGIAALSPTANSLTLLFESIGINGKKVLTQTAQEDEGQALEVARTNSSDSAVTILENEPQEEQTIKASFPAENPDSDPNPLSEKEADSSESINPKNTNATEAADSSLEQKTSAQSGSEQKASDKKKSEKAKPPRAEKQLGSELLGLIDTVCQNTMDHDALFNGNSSFKEFGFNHPLLRAQKPSGREARLYSATKISVFDGNYYVYSSWNPANIARLKRVAERYS